MLNESLFRDYIDAVQHLCKGRVSGVDVAKIEAGKLYVLDWRPDRPDEYDTITVDLVEEICWLGPYRMVRSRGSETDIETFAALVVAGPFDAGRGCDAK